MEAPEYSRAVAAARMTAASHHLPAEDAVVLHDSNKLTLRLRPCDVLARVAPVAHQNAQFEIDVARRLAQAGSPVAALDPRVEPHVHLRDGFAITLWTYYEPASSEEIAPADFAQALEGLHAGLREVDVPAPHFTARVGEAQEIVADPGLSPDLPPAERELLSTTLQRLRRTIGERSAPEQLLHGEPHPGNLLATEAGPRFIDFETCCRGPVEFDLAHAPAAVAEYYPGIDRGLLDDCRILVLAMVTAWRWEVGDQLPHGRERAAEWTAEIRAALARSARDAGRPHAG
ncbi:phosphotransferase [Streptomyces sp. NPDC004134]|uniref:phosphotransferase n=1 Tax=Streptomyces sp. NPDC004134 TaxID=3364691 RepID=UPI00369E5CD4